MTIQVRYPWPAPEGTVWVCSACGKTSFNKAGLGAGGWDEACTLNAVLCYADKRLDDRGVFRWHAVSEEDRVEELFDPDIVAGDPFVEDPADKGDANG